MLHRSPKERYDPIGIAARKEKPGEPLTNQRLGPHKFPPLRPPLVEVLIQLIRQPGVGPAVGIDANDLVFPFHGLVALPSTCPPPALAALQQTAYARGPGRRDVRTGVIVPHPQPQSRSIVNKPGPLCALVQ